MSIPELLEMWRENDPGSGVTSAYAALANEAARLHDKTPITQELLERDGWFRKDAELWGRGCGGLLKLQRPGVWKLLGDNTCGYCRTIGQLRCLVLADSCNAV